MKIHVVCSNDFPDCAFFDEHKAYVYAREAYTKYREELRTAAQRGNNLRLVLFHVKTVDIKDASIMNDEKAAPRGRLMEERVLFYMMNMMALGEESAEYHAPRLLDYLNGKTSEDESQIISG